MPIDRLPLAYLRCDADFCVLEWNSTAESLFGYQTKEALGRRATDLILSQPVSEQVQDVIRRLRSGDMNANSVNQNRTKDGRILTCAWFNTRLIDQRGDFAGVIFLGDHRASRGSNRH